LGKADDDCEDDCADRLHVAAFKANRDVLPGRPHADCRSHALVRPAGKVIQPKKLRGALDVLSGLHVGGFGEGAT
jgi:hypothetical protein